MESLPTYAMLEEPVKKVLYHFGHILNITIEVDKCSVLEDDVTFQRFAIFDFGGDKQQQTMFEFFPDACALIKQHMASGRRPVLMHCVEGKERSCAVVAAYLMASQAMTVAKAKDFIIQKRPEAFDGGARVNFAPALERWEKTVSAAATDQTESRLAARVLPAPRAPWCPKRLSRRILLHESVRNGSIGFVP